MAMYLCVYVSAIDVYICKDMQSNVVWVFLFSITLSDSL